MGGLFFSALEPIRPESVHVKNSPSRLCEQILLQWLNFTSRSSRGIGSQLSKSDVAQ